MTECEIFKNLKEEVLFNNVKNFLFNISQYYGELHFVIIGLKKILELKDFSLIPTYTLSNLPPNDNNALIYYHETGYHVSYNLQCKYQQSQYQIFIVKLYEEWERFRCTCLKKYYNKKVESNIFGDLRNLRNDIVHNKSYKKDSKKNKIIIKNEELLLFNEMEINFILEKIFDYFENELLINSKFKFASRSLNQEIYKLHKSINHSIV